MLGDPDLAAAEIPLLTSVGFAVAAPWLAENDPLAAVRGTPSLWPDWYREWAARMIAVPALEPFATELPDRVVDAIDADIGMVACGPDPFLVSSLLERTRSKVFVRIIGRPPGATADDVVRAFGGAALAEVTAAHPGRVFIAHSHGLLADGRNAIACKAPTVVETPVGGSLDGVRAVIALGNHDSNHRDSNLCRLLELERGPDIGSDPWTERVDTTLVAWSGSPFSAHGVSLEAIALGVPVIHWKDGPLGSLVGRAFTCERVKDALTLTRGLASRPRGLPGSTAADEQRDAFGAISYPKLRATWDKISPRLARSESFSVSPVRSRLRVLVMTGTTEPAKLHLAGSVAGALAQGVADAEAPVDIALGVPETLLESPDARSLELAKRNGVPVRPIAPFPTAGDIAGPFGAASSPYLTLSDSANDLLDCEAIVLIGEPAGFRLPPTIPLVVVSDGFPARWSALLAEAQPRAQIADCVLPTLRSARAVICLDRRTALDVHNLAGVPQRRIVSHGAVPPIEPNAGPGASAEPRRIFVSAWGHALGEATFNAAMLSLADRVDFEPKRRAKPTPSNHDRDTTDRADREPAGEADEESTEPGRDTGARADATPRDVQAENDGRWRIARDVGPAAPVPAGCVLVATEAFVSEITFALDRSAAGAAVVLPDLPFARELAANRGGAASFFTIGDDRSLSNAVREAIARAAHPIESQQGSAGWGRRVLDELLTLTGNSRAVGENADA
jgi:hypothetical protein